MYQPPAYNNPPPGLVDSRNRPKGQNPADYILPSLTVMTHPGLALAKPVKLRVPASPTQLHQCVTITLPPAHAFVQIRPHIPVGLTPRPYRIFVIVNGARVSEGIKAGVERDKSRPLFDARLERGIVNRIEVEVLAGKIAGGGKTGKEEVQWEKMTVFVHVLKG
jgi:hypothetical protein